VAAFAEKRIERITLVPTLLRAMLPALTGGDKLLPEEWIWNVSGEPLSPEVLREATHLRPRDTFVNLYGSAEVAGDVTFGAPSTSEYAHVGRPIAGCDVLVLDEELQLVPAYVEGDVYVTGVALARGYWSNAARTADRFIPGVDGVGERMYRSGDRGYWLRDGTLRLVGRRDRQIKRRGVRIDLDAIVSSLEELTSMAGVAAVWIPQMQQLIAIVQLQTPPDLKWIAIPDSAELKVAMLDETMDRKLWATIGAALAAAALPDRLFVVNRLPRTSAGKVRYSVLTAARWPDIQAHAATQATISPTEQTLIAICERILKKSGVQPADRFLQIGMTSLHLVHVVHGVAEEFGIRLKLSQLYASTSLRHCAQLIDEAI
jgi:acyl-coenzyme A synthetase/AMP-(fatty) acid ligase/acyl carrier protein